VKGVKGTKGGHFEPATAASPLLTGDTVVDPLLLRLDPPIPLGNLLVDAAAHPRSDDSDVLRIIPRRHPRSIAAFVGIDLPGLSTGAIAREHRPIVQVLQILAFEYHRLTVHPDLLENRVTGQRHHAQ